MRTHAFDIKTTIRGSVPRVPFEVLKKSVLGSHYELSLVVCGDTLAQRINIQYRKKDYFPNVLSFELEKNSGEIFLNVRKAEREARSLGVSTQKRLALLYVHGLYHLKGMKHGEKMENEEKKVLKKFSLL
ncbi:MAG: rRNA maturation RNase YbeY [Candidatus Paceibacterota bacterium]